MNKLMILTLIIVLFWTRLFGQTTVDVAENTFKVGILGGEQAFYYGFSEGDQLVFNFQEMNGKELKKVEIIELPSSSKFMDYKTKKIEKKILNIQRTGIYKFIFSNAALSGRICKMKIQRIPASDETKNFNTSVYWKTVYDTTYTTIQEKYLIRVDTTILNITDQVAKVHSQSNINNNKTTFNFTLPSNTVAWSYYIGVDQAGQQAYQYATSQLSERMAPLISKIPGYGPLAALALGCTSYLYYIQTGEDFDFYIVEGNNVNLFLAGRPFYYVKKGKIINDYSKMLTPLAGTYHVCLANDNAITSVTVTVKITAITVTEQWGYRPVQKMQVSSRQEAYLKK